TTNDDAGMSALRPGKRPHGISLQSRTSPTTPAPMISPTPWLKQLLPFLDWPVQWRRHGVRGDVIAGITVGLVLVPQALAYAQLASLPPYIGLYAALLPAVVAALFGSCGGIATGPVALTALLTGASLVAVARPGTEDFIAAAILLA